MRNGSQVQAGTRKWGRQLHEMFGKQSRRKSGEHLILKFRSGLGWYHMMIPHAKWSNGSELATARGQWER